MASAKRTPKVSRISRGRTVAYARKQKTPPEGDGGDGGDDRDGTEDGGDEAVDPSANPAEPGAPEPGAAEPGAAEPASALPAPVAIPPVPAPVVRAAGSGPAITPPATVEPAPAQPPSSAAATAPAAPAVPAVPAPLRSRSDTVTMPMQTLGTPPAMPSDAAAPAPANVTSAEDPTQMPGPLQIPGGNPGDPASPPGLVPKGDSRSLRRYTEGAEFALIYRAQTFVITRVGLVGTRGVWRVVEYPTSAYASHAYAKECSRFVSEGFSDYRG